MFWKEKQQGGQNNKDLYYTAIHYEFSGGRSLWDVHQDTQRPELHENEVKTHYTRSELFLRGLCANETHMEKALHVLGNSPCIVGRDYDFMTKMSATSCKMIDAGMAASVIRAKFPPEESMIHRIPFHAPAPEDIYLKVLTPINITNADGSVDTFPEGVQHGDLKVYGIDANDDTLFNWFVRFSGIRGHGRDGFVWLDDTTLPNVLKSGCAIVVALGLNGILTHVLGSKLSQEISGIPGFKGAAPINIASTTDTDLDRLDKEFLENSKERQQGRALGWLSWIYHPQQGIIQDDTRYKRYKSRGRFGI